MKGFKPCWITFCSQLTNQLQRSVQWYHTAKRFCRFWTSRWSSDCRNVNWSCCPSIDSCPTITLLQRPHTQQSMCYHSSPESRCSILIRGRERNSQKQIWRLTIWCSCPRMCCTTRYHGNQVDHLRFRDKKGRNLGPPHWGNCAKEISNILVLCCVHRGRANLDKHCWHYNNKDRWPKEVVGLFTCTAGPILKWVSHLRVF